MLFGTVMVFHDSLSSVRDANLINCESLDECQLSKMLWRATGAEMNTSLLSGLTLSHSQYVY